MAQVEGSGTALDIFAVVATEKSVKDFTLDGWLFAANSA
jgi:hypothetical protein